jgi:hypothetical protein
LNYWKLKITTDLEERILVLEEKENERTGQ